MSSFGIYSFGLVVVVMTTLRPVSMATMNDTKTLIKDLLNGYNINVRPVLNQSEVVNVNVSLSLKSIQEFDEVKEIMSFVAGVFLTWKDEGMVWNPDLYGGVEFLTVSYWDVWVPEVVLTNPSEDLRTMGQKWQRVRYAANGVANWIPGDLFKTYCSVDVRLYPFDTQVCQATFSPWGYNLMEIRLNPPDDTVGIALFIGNGAWSIDKTTARHSIFGGQASEITFELYLKRKPAFVIINVILPIMFLGLLNVLVFVLVPESGERVSFCITVLLAITVFMTIISDTLPKTSEPVPFISYTLMLNVVTSALITLVTILNMRLYHTDEEQEVPQ